MAVEKIEGGKRYNVCSLSGCGNPAKYKITDTNHDVIYLCSAHHKLNHEPQKLSMRVELVKFL